MPFLNTLPFLLILLAGTLLLRSYRRARVRRRSSASLIAHVSYGRSDGVAGVFGPKLDASLAFLRKVPVAGRFLESLSAVLTPLMGQDVGIGQAATAALLFILASGLASTLFMDQPVLGLAGGSLGLVVGARYLHGRVPQMRAGRLRRQLPAALDALASSVGAGHTLPEAFSRVAGELPEPVSGQFRQAVQEVRVAGLQPEEALERMYRRTGVEDLWLAAASTRLIRAVGVHLLPGMYVDLATAMRQRAEAARRAETATLQTRLSSLGVLVVGPLIILVMAAGNADYLAPLVSSATGRFILTAALLWTALGLIVMRIGLRFLR